MSPRTFCIMGLRVTFRGKVKPIGEAVAKASPNRAKQSRDVDPKPERSTHVQVEGAVTRTGGPNPPMLKNRGMRCG